MNKRKVLEKENIYRRKRKGEEETTKSKVRVEV